MSEGYLTGWRQSGPVRPGPASDGSTCLVFAFERLGRAVAACLRQRGLRVVSVRPGGHYRADPDGGRLVDPTCPEHYLRLVSEVSAGGRIGHVAHLWNVSAGPEEPGRTQDLGLHSLLGLAQAFGACAAGGAVRVVAVTAGAQDVLGGEVRHPGRATIHGAVRAIAREYAGIACSSVDVPGAAGGARDLRWLAGRLVDELMADPDAPTVALRGRRRWLPALVPLPLEPAPGASPRLWPGGVYLVCGGLGRLGLTLGERLASLPARVVLTRRSPFPAREDWPGWLRERPDDPAARTIARLLAAEAAGGEVLVRRADVASAVDMRALVAEVVDRFGRLDGVVHAAGAADGAGAIQRRSREDTDAAISASVRGAMVLDEVLEGRRLDFLLLCPSLAPGESGEVGEVASSEFLSAFAAHRATRDGGVTTAVCWPGRVGSVEVLGRLLATGPPPGVVILEESPS